MRDLRAIGSKVVQVLHPTAGNAVLRDWDLWGPLVVRFGPFHPASESLPDPNPVLPRARRPAVDERSAQPPHLPRSQPVNKVFLLAATAEQSLPIFTGVFVLVWVGSIIITLNAKLLGGKVSVVWLLSRLGALLMIGEPTGPSSRVYACSGTASSRSTSPRSSPSSCACSGSAYPSAAPPSCGPSGVRIPLPRYPFCH